MPKGFKIQVSFKSLTFQEDFQNFNQESTVGSVRTQIKEVISELRTNKFTIFYCGNELIHKHKKLKEYISTKRKNITLLITVDQIGGTQLETRSSGFPKDVFEDCQKTTCVVYNTTMECIKMDCGHWFSWEGLRGEVKRQYLLDKYHKLQCFKCSEEWEIGDTIWMCGFNKKDTETFEKEFSKRKQGASCVECPSCGNIGKRKLDVKIHRLACGLCGVNFCLHCEKKWTRSGMVLCGNTECINYDIQDQLDNCKLLTKSINEKNRGNYYRWIEWCGENIPVIRACPKCLCIIRFKDKCQHMTCPSCTHEFCYICLGDWKNSNKETIHSYVSENKQCKTAPRQKFR